MSFEQKMIPEVQCVKRKRFLNAIAILYFARDLSGITLQVPTAACWRVFLISSRIPCECKCVSASRNIRYFPREFFAPRLRALDTLRSFMMRTRAYFFAIAAVASVHPLQTTMTSASFGSDFNVASM